MKYLLVLISLIFVGCSLPTQPSFVIYMPRSDELTKSIVQKGVEIAESNDMAYASVDEVLYKNKYEGIFEATNSGWLHRSLSIGYPKGGAFSIGLNGKEIVIALSHVDGVSGVRSLKEQWQMYLVESNINYRVEGQPTEH